MSDIANTILETIEYAIDNKLSNAGYDKTLICTVVDIRDGKAKLLRNGTEYVVQLQHSPTFNINDKVHLKLPLNNIVQKYIEEDIKGSGGGSDGVGAVLSVNGQQGTVVLTANDIQYADGTTLKNKIDSLVQGRQIIMSANAPTNQLVGDIWYKKLS